jgi:hypothetical protein
MCTGNEEETDATNHCQRLQNKQGLESRVTAVVVCIVLCLFISASEQSWASLRNCLNPFITSDLLGPISNTGTREMELCLTIQETREWLP